MSDLRVPFVDLKQRWQEERVDLIAIFDRIGSQGHFVLTPEVADFEQRVQEYTGARHCVGLNSGTDALYLGLRALGIGPGDEVITAPNSFVASAGAVVQLGARPTFADVLPDQTLDPADLERRITPRTRAVMPVHWTGRIAHMDAIQAIAERHGLLVVEDSAQSMGAYYRGRHGGTFGRFGGFSCHPLKNLNALGDGGFLLTDDDELAASVRLLRNHGLRDRDTVVVFGLNSRLDSLHAAVLAYRLERLQKAVEARRCHADLYRRLLVPGPVFVPSDRPEQRSAYVMFIVQADDRDDLRKHLLERGIESLVYYGTPLHLQPAASALGYRRGDFPEAERQAERVLALPCHQYLSDDQIACVAESVNAFYGS